MYSSAIVSSAVVVVLEAVYVMERTQLPDILFAKYDTVTELVREIMVPNLENKSYETDKQDGLEQYKRLYKHPVSALQKLLVTSPNEVPIKKVLLVLATKLQEKLAERETQTQKREAIIDLIAYGLMSRCESLMRELKLMDMELTETGKVEVLTL